jgi:hypothetical protein
MVYFLKEKIRPNDRIRDICRKSLWVYVRRGCDSLVGEVVVHLKDRMWVEEAVIQWQERL